MEVNGYLLDKPIHLLYARCMTKQLTHLHIETGPGGWARVFWRRESGPENVVFVRFRPPQPRKRLRWEIVALHTTKRSALTSALLDDIPRDRIRLAVVASDVFREGLLRDMDDEVPSDLDSAFRGKYQEAPRSKLERPPRSEMNDDFYRGVALAYRQAVAAGRPPLKTLADDSGLARGTIARWIAEARERKFLPATEPGKVSA